MQRLGALVLFLCLVLGQSVLQSVHDAPVSRGVIDDRSAPAHDAVAAAEQTGCPHEHEHDHDPTKCGICKQLFLAKSLVAADQPDDFIVEFIEVPDGRVIGLVRRANPELANARNRGPPAADL